MKKVLTFAAIMMVLATALLVNVGAANAYYAPPPNNHPPKVVVYSPYFEGLEPGERLQAQMFAESDFQEIYCVVTQNDGHVSCQAPKKYAGQSVVLYINVGGKTLIFYVKLPAEKETPILT